MKNKNIRFLFCLLLLISIINEMHAMNDDYYKMVEYAIKAPSGHNTQPWMFRISENSIDILPDFTKTLSVVDGDNRELFISLGCAAENLCIAASVLSYETDMLVSEQGEITIYLNKSDSIRHDILFSEIEKRQTNRSIYNSKFIEDEVLNDCLSVVSREKGLGLYPWRNGTESFESLKQLVMEGNILQMDDDMFVKELKSWMRINRKESDALKDGLSYDVFGAPNLPAFIARPAIGSFLNSKKQNKGDLNKIESSSHFILFTTTNNTIQDWIVLGREMQRFLLKLTAFDIAHAYMNQPCEVEKLRLKISEQLSIKSEYPQILLRVGYGKSAPYARRRNVSDVIIE